MSKKPVIFKRIVSLRERYYLSAEGKSSLLDMISEREVAVQVYNTDLTI